MLSSNHHYQSKTQVNTRREREISVKRERAQYIILYTMEIRKGKR